MSDTYEIYAPNGVILDVDKKTNKIYFKRNKKETGDYTEAYSQALFKAWHIMEDYKNSYKPIYLDPSQVTGQSSTLNAFKSWQTIYLKDPAKGAIAPWTKKEKAYFESLKTKRERYKYLVIRSGIRSAIMDIPLDAIANVNEYGKLINEKYENIYYEINKIENKYEWPSDLIKHEIGISKGMLGNIKAWPKEYTGFSARFIQAYILHIQLTGGDSILSKPGLLGGLYEYGHNIPGYGLVGVHKNKARAKKIEKLAETLKPDKFGMLPYIDEIMGVDWVLDWNVMHDYSTDRKGHKLDEFEELVQNGSLKDPRDSDSTKETREAFDAYKLKTAYFERYDVDIANDKYEDIALTRMDTMLLEAKVMAVTPRQGYPNAPTYYTPEHLEELYKEGKLDKKLDPRIPAIQRDNFPQSLRDEIESYAKKHNIKN
ncbi:hypothetical protein DCO58_02490 [Helicobacter saguini]|uniref:Thioredoxin reductase n=1 Tax=Helicobacter saguini TaxID=1548018 RepID=A0A347VRW1_9HELI|nr:hypothetical protein [Helicobacter saguini]MWV62755.1 hypothetical protein [Helicobacter saguini]MWV66576.1 hypothetical protein [Helicobacter saguini]MWV68925.1 hypothetical protein [Helicobacter saguini]MWV71520.1 hypothetical protein [Helicobacter saguini]TLD93618.1 hypothetical protein LS64_008285 [Helicobacter saguini]